MLLPLLSMHTHVTKKSVETSVFEKPFTSSEEIILEKSLALIFCLTFFKFPEILEIVSHRKSEH